MLQKVIYRISYSEIIGNYVDADELTWFCAKNWGVKQSPSRQRFWLILKTQKRYWWHLKCAFFYVHDLSFHAHPCLNRAHRICVYFVWQKLPHPFPVHLLLALRGTCPLPATTVSITMMWTRAKSMCAPSTQVKSAWPSICGQMQWVPANGKWCSADRDYMCEGRYGSSPVARKAVWSLVKHMSYLTALSEYVS